MDTRAVHSSAVGNQLSPSASALPSRHLGRATKGRLPKIPQCQKTIVWCLSKKIRNRVGKCILNVKILRAGRRASASNARGGGSDFQCRRHPPVFLTVKRGTSTWRPVEWVTHISRRRASPLSSVFPSPL